MLEGISRISSLMALCLLASLLVPVIEVGAQSLDPKSMPETAAKIPPKIIRVTSDHWPGLTQSDGSGLSFEIIKAVYEPLGIKTRFYIEPFKRAKLAAVNHHYDVVVGTYSQSYRGNDLLLTPQYPIGVDEVLAIYPADSSLTWTQFLSRNSRQVEEGEYYIAGWSLGYNYDQHFDIKKGKELHLTEQGLKMVAQRRLDVYLDDFDNVDNVLSNKLPALREKLRFEPILKRRTFLAFSNNPHASELCKIYDRRLSIMLKNGTLKAIFEDWGYDMSRIDFDSPDDHGRQVFCEHTAQ